LKHGEGGKGIKSRWYPETLKKRILDIAHHADRVEFIEGDGLDYIRENAHRKEWVWFLDPPYTAGNGKRAGKRLYRHCTLDHGKLFALAESLSGDFLMTYDDAFEVRELAASHGFDMEAISMRGTHLSERKELLIGRNLSWVRQAR
jgi:DNA adenine methylase